MSNEVAVRQEAGAVGAVVDFGELAGAGLEGSTISDQKIPFIVALQGQSQPVLAEGSQVRAGQLYNTVTGEAWDGKTGIVVVPAYVERKIARFKPDQEGFVGRLELNDPVVIAAQKRHDELGLPFGKLFTAYTDDGKPAGDQLVDTRYVYVVLCDDAGKDPVGYAIVAFKSTDTDECKRYFGTTLAQFLAPKPGGGKQRTPLFAHPTRITLELNKYKVGAAYNFVCAPAFGSVRENYITDLNDPRFVEGKNLWQLVKSGAIRADFGAAASDAAGSSDIPF